MLVKCVFTFIEGEYVEDSIRTGTIWDTTENPFLLSESETIGLKLISGLSDYNYIRISYDTFVNCFERGDLD